MNAVGNDNYKPDMKPPEPMRQKTGWLSSNMAQLMVFLNGLILTVTAFATLTVFIDEIVKEGLIKNTQEVKEYVLSKHSETQRSFSALSAILVMMQNSSSEQVKSYIKEKSSGIDSFSDLYWIENKGGDEWKTLSLMAADNPDRLFDDPEQLKKLIRPEIFVTNKIYVLTDIVKRDNAKSPAAQNSYAIIKKVRKSDGRDSFLFGLTSFDRKISSTWLESRTALYNFQILDTSRDKQLYFYQPNTNKKQLNASKFLNIFNVTLSDVPVDIKVELAMSGRESFLQKIPLLMLLFGITLTLIGTLYVRNNQRQSKKLALMNKELAVKNFELNQEVSERERLNQVIQNSAREHRSIINAVNDIIFEASVDGKLMYLNESWNKVTGFELDRSIGRNLFDLIYVQDQEEQRFNFGQLVQGKKQSYRAFTRLRSADGSFRAVELNLSMLRQDDNRDMRVVGTITDVEERRRAERALSEAEKKYRAIVENAAGGIYQVTPDGQFLSANPAFARIIGYKNPEEVLRDIHDAKSQIYVDTKDRERFLREVKVLDSPKNYEAQLLRKDGEIIWVSENVRPVKDDEGVLLFYEGSMEDVDQRRQAEIALKEAKMESDLANRAKSEFLANMSHELRTPLNAVIGFSEIIKNESFGPLPSEEYKEYAGNIFTSGQNLLNVINDILDVSRIEAGNRTLSESVVEVSETVESCLSLMENKIKNSKMRIENKLADSKFSFVGEKHAVKQMLLNLLSNAIKFSSSESTVLLDAELDNRKRLRLSVTDTGIGLTDDELKKALSPFGQVDTEHSRSKSGTGLGLTLVKSLMELHGGELEIVSQKNIGTTATLIFPAKRVAQSTGTRSENSETAQGDTDYISI
jgi:PAS domain S-box-containing protein